MDTRSIHLDSNILKIFLYFRLKSKCISNWKKTDSDENSRNEAMQIYQRPLNADPKNEIIA